MFEVRDTQEVFRGKVISLRRDLVEMPGGVQAWREVVAHPGAVGIVALDEQDRVLVVSQFRHPVRQHLIELPAGLLDVEGEPAWRTAQRELAEEGLLRADTWHVLADGLSSAGMTDEAVRVFLARDLSPVARPEGFVVEHEEADMALAWVPLDDLVAAVHAGEVRNTLCCLGVLAAWHARATGWQQLRPHDAPWPDRPGHQ